ncbi:SDR family NAD(P)-dependent oxidoreductase [Jannaschia formosa]|uniref:SDR family NAD(P)-dependent oxidoreductase n=1 Tax=Jannaschia formosa TaxID=2259592 RepID=UPI000E1C3C7F|nr:SDR family NAD(P)-dependent oxidoreductase [Jannaschia formosa]TFL16349.1 SDR family NAD(P)-dependent oxidoreductase [Jannaschia formosa]
MTDAKRLALVTGANRGIGREVALQLAREHGFHVLVGARDLSKGEAAAADIGQGAEAIEVDVAEVASVARAIDIIGDRFGKLDVLVNNAAVDYDTDQKASSADLDRVRRAFATNLFGPWSIAIAAIPLLRRSISPRIVNVSSGSGSLTDMDGGTAGYGISKAALNALTLKLADELRGDGILVNAVCPGWVATDMGGGGRPVPEGALGVVWAATLPDGGPTGGFFRDGKRIDW